MHQDGGFIVQPFATAALSWAGPNDITVTPYVTAFQSMQLDGRSSLASSGVVASGSDVPCSILHHHGSAAGWVTVTGTGADWYQAEFMLGVVTAYRGLTVDVNYNFYAYPSGSFFPLQEVGTKVSYECASLWRDPEKATFFGLKPFAALYHETANRFDHEATYLETGIEPSYRFHLWNRNAGISVPIAAGMSIDNYYVNAQGDNEFFGYWSAGLHLSVPLPVPTKCGSWYLSASVRYYHFQAESLRAIAGHPDEFVGKVGLSFAF